MKEMARGKWGFNGYITSDCGAVEDVYSTHKYEPNPSKVVKDVLEAGMDSDCGGFLGQHMEKAIQDGTVTKDDYNAALTNMFKVRMRVGQFDPVAIQPYMAYGTDRIDTPAHRELALSAAKQGIVLLKNDKSTLPLKVRSLEWRVYIVQSGECMRRVYRA
jgi:beta-glucosidase-like glycosyl hydrolase